MTCQKDGKTIHPCEAWRGSQVFGERFPDLFPDIQAELWF